MTSKSKTKAKAESESKPEPKAKSKQKIKAVARDPRLPIRNIPVIIKGIHGGEHQAVVVRSPKTWGSGGTRQWALGQLISAHYDDLFAYLKAFPEVWGINCGIAGLRIMREPAKYGLKIKYDNRQLESVIGLGPSTGTKLKSM